MFVLVQAHVDAPNLNRPYLPRPEGKIMGGPGYYVGSLPNHWISSVSGINLSSGTSGKCMPLKHREEVYSMDALRGTDEPMDYTGNPRRLHRLCARYVPANLRTR